MYERRLHVLQGPRLRPEAGLARSLWISYVLISGMPASARITPARWSRLQALVEQEVGERDGDDREEAAEHRDEAQQAAGGGDREGAVGAGVEQADDRRVRERAAAARGPWRAGRSRPGSGRRRARARQTPVSASCSAAAVEEDEREADRERGEQREIAAPCARPRRRRRGSMARERDAGQRRDHADPLQRRRAARRRAARPRATGTIAQVATIGATMLIVPSASAR